MNMMDKEIIDLATSLVHALHTDGRETENKDIAKGFHSIDIMVHNNNEIVIEKIGEWEYRGSINL